MKSWLPYALGFTALSVGAVVPELRTIVNPPVKPVGLEAQDSHAAASLLGQFRTSMSAWMFLRADLYLHNGVEMRPLTSAEIKSGKKGVGNGEGHKEQLHNDNVIVTVVPAKNQDFRGVLGDIERATSSYKDMKGHTHNNPRTTLPLFRLMTWLDPQFVPGWTTGATILRWENNAAGQRQAIDFLQQGLENNPNSIDILTQIAFIYARRDAVSQQRDLAKALPYLEKARKIGFENQKALSDSEKEALVSTYRWLGLVCRENGKLDLMRAVAREGLSIFPDDGILQKMLQK